MNSRDWMVAAASAMLMAGAAVADTAEQRGGVPNASDSTTSATPAGSAPRGSSQPGSSSVVGGDAASHGEAQRSRRLAEGRAGSARATAGQSATVAPIVMLLVPMQLQQQKENPLADGCWAKLYGRRNLQGDILTLVGPVEMSTMNGPFDVDWGEKVRSMQAGPRATVTIYDAKNFRDRATLVQQGKTVEDLGMRMGLFEKVSSIRIDCSAPPKG